MMESGGSIRGSFEYSTDLFDEATIVRMMSHFQQLLQSIVADPNTQITRLPLLSEAERAQQLSEWNETAVEYPRQLTLPQLFEAQAAVTPAAVARSLKQASKLWRVERARESTGALPARVGSGA